MRTGGAKYAYNRAAIQPHARAEAYALALILVVAHEQEWCLRNDLCPVAFKADDDFIFAAAAPPRSLSRRRSIWNDRAASNARGSR